MRPPTNAATVLVIALAAAACGTADTSARPEAASSASEVVSSPDHPRDWSHGCPGGLVVSGEIEVDFDSLAELGENDPADAARDFAATAEAVRDDASERVEVGVRASRNPKGFHGQHGPVFELQDAAG